MLWRIAMRLDVCVNSLGMIRVHFAHADYSKISLCKLPGTWLSAHFLASGVRGVTLMRYSEAVA